MSTNIARFHVTEIGQVIDRAAQTFSSGFSQAFVDFVSGTKSAEEAFKSFAADFLKATAQMILETTILNAVKAGINSYFGGGASSVGSGGDVSGGDYPPTSDTTFANGGIRFAGSGLMTVSSPTYFPKFRTIAGEIPGQPEMLTVLNNPKMMSIGGIQAAVGNAAGNKLAITGADALARAAGGGQVDININLEPGLVANITNNAPKVAVVTINRDSKRNTDFARNIKGLVQ